MTLGMVSAGPHPGQNFFPATNSRAQGFQVYHESDPQQANALFFLTWGFCTPKEEELPLIEIPVAHGHAISRAGESSKRSFSVCIFCVRSKSTWSTNVFSCIEGPHHN
jgi:hypothetical protein